MTPKPALTIEARACHHDPGGGPPSVLDARSVGARGAPMAAPGRSRPLPTTRAKPDTTAAVPLASADHRLRSADWRHVLRACPDFGTHNLAEACVRSVANRRCQK